MVAAYQDGHPVPILIGAARLQSVPLQWICFVLDLTERTRMEQRLRQAREAETLGFLAAGVPMISITC